ncbi:MAG: hypothetical protein ACT4SY_03830 [Hyphomicrobiales bacterium]
MEKVLPGTSHAVLTFIRQRWADLLQVSLLPVLIVLALAVTLYLAVQPLISSLFGMQAGGQTNPQIIGRLMQFYGFMALAGLLCLLVFVWLYVRIVRLYALDEKYWVGLNGTVIKATLMTVVYGTGIYLLTFLAYVVAVVAVLVPAAILGALATAAAGDSGWVAGPTAIGTIALVAALPLFLAWFFCRFMVGLPGVALGRSPAFFREMWSLSKGESWGVPLRLLFGALVYFAIAIPVLVLAMWPMISDISELAGTAESGRISPETIQTMMSRMVPGQIVMGLIQIPWTWFSVLVFAEAYRRFTAR